MGSYRHTVFLLGFSFILVSINGAVFWTIFRVFIYDIGGSFLEVAMISAIQNVFSVFLAPFWGSLGDELNWRKPFIVIGSLSVSFFTTLFISAKKVVEYLTIFIFASLFYSMVNPNLNALISLSVEREKRGKALGYFFGINAIGWTLGGILSGLLAEAYGMNYVFILSAIVGLLGGLTILLFLHEDKASISFKKAVRDAWRKVIDVFRIQRERSFNILLLSVILHGTGGGIFFTLFQIKFFEAVSRNYAIYGIVSGLSGIGSIIAPPFYGSLTDKIGRKLVMQATLFIYSIYFIILGIFWDPIILTILWFLPLWPGVRISSIALAADIAGEKRIGKYQGLLESINALARISGALIGGLLADIYGARANLGIIDNILMLASIGPFIAALVISKIKE